MKFFTSIVLVMFFVSCNTGSGHNNNMMEKKDSITGYAGNYVLVNNIRMYYEVYGKGKPLVLLHGGGSTIHTTFGRIVHELAKTRQVIGVELQGHGHTGDRDSGFSFEQDADDVAGLLKQLGIKKADIFGFSNGGTTAFQLAIRHPGMVNKVIAASPLLKRSGAPDQFWEFMSHATIDQMPQAYKDAYRRTAPYPERLQAMHDKCARRMVEFRDISDEQIQSVKAPVLLMNGDADVATSEHMVAMSKMIPDCRLAIFPGTHGKYIGEITTLTDGSGFRPYCVPLIEEFLDAVPGVK